MSNPVLCCVERKPLLTLSVIEMLPFWTTENETCHPLTFEWIHLFLAERCGRFPPVVKTAVPVDGRFEHIVLSCNATSDHAIIWIEKEAKWALEVSFIFLPSLYAECLKFNGILEDKHSFTFLYSTFSFVVLLSLSIIVHEVKLPLGDVTHTKTAETEFQFFQV